MLTVTLQSFLDKVEWGKSFDWDGVTFIPLMAESPLSDLSFLLLPEALQARKVAIREVGDGEIRELEAEVKSAEPILALQGTILQGGKQDRTLNISLLLAPKQRQRIPVSCVERGRWGYRRSSPFKAAWAAAMVAHAPLRHFLCLTAHTAYRITGEVRADQQQIWGEVRRASRRAGVISETEAVGEVYCSLREKAEEILEGMRGEGFPLPKQVGMISVVAGRVWGLDLLPNPTVWVKVWEGIVQSNLFGILVRERGGREGENGEAARAFWSALRENEGEVKKSPVGLGEHWLLRPPLEGFALVYRDSLLHLFAFSPSEDRP
jgi:hypothetical protein